MQKVKKIGIFSGIVVIMSMCFFTIKVEAEEKYKDNIKIIELLTFDKTTLLNKLLEYGLVLPRYFDLDRHSAEKFVFNFTHEIIENNVDEGAGAYGFNQTVVLSDNLVKTIKNISNTKNRRLSQLFRVVHTNYIFKDDWNEE